VFYNDNDDELALLVEKEMPKGDPAKIKLNTRNVKNDEKYRENQALLREVRLLRTLRTFQSAEGHVRIRVSWMGSKVELCASVPLGHTPTRIHSERTNTSLHATQGCNGMGRL
jgi:hypothetical protein